MDNRNLKNKPCCCIYCKEEFMAIGKQKWHRCDKALAVQRYETNEKSKAWKKLNHYRQPDRRFGNIHVGKDTWKQCKRCRALTPNRFGHCGNCLDTLSTLYDLDGIMTFEAGHERRVGYR
jgi:hypothetical protein